MHLPHQPYDSFLVSYQFREGFVSTCLVQFVVAAHRFWPKFAGGDRLATADNRIADGHQLALPVSMALSNFSIASCSGRTSRPSPRRPDSIAILGCIPLKNPCITAASVRK